MNFFPPKAQIFAKGKFQSCIPHSRCTVGCQENQTQSVCITVLPVLVLKSG